RDGRSGRGRSPRRGRSSAALAQAGARNRLGGRGGGNVEARPRRQRRGRPEPASLPFATIWLPCGDGVSETGRAACLTAPWGGIVAWRFGVGGTTVADRRGDAVKQGLRRRPRSHAAGDPLQARAEQGARRDR